ncbi:MAG TPA: bifunctional precorrin-2 dehydrogenase/sirohydrochlorin ferrochelatase [Pseudomonadales bacterium]|nr:bifunctional precorrin-2 dehydrogenase/sirohydrochlorin ferrochelatase [Pseudomonadales bacterium]
MQYFPLFVDTQGLRVLIVGAGEVASRKLDLLARTQADISVISPEISDEIQAYAERKRIRVYQRAIQDADVHNVDLIYLATANDALNARLATLASERGIWANVVDNPEYCRFITPSIVDRGRLVVAISTAGAAPVFARTIRAKLETWLPQSLAPLFDFVAERRQEVQQKLPSSKQRRVFWERFFDLNAERFDANTTEHYQNAFSQLGGKGELLLIDSDTPPHLLPLAAMPLLQRLDAVCSDEVLPSMLNELVRRDAQRQSVPNLSELAKGYEQGAKVLVYSDKAKIDQLIAHFPMAKHLRAGAI